ncbi:MAG: rhodanese-like domain-containing protein [Pseudomonadota bacterium]
MNIHFLHRGAWAVVLMLFALLAHAEEVPTPTTLPGGKVVTIQEAKALLDAGKALFIDTRNPINFGRGHVPGAKLVSYDAKSEKVADFDASLDKFALEELPGDKERPIVFYSHGVTGWKSYKAAVMALRHGYKNVFWMREGMDAWTAAKYPEER